MNIFPKFCASRYCHESCRNSVTCLEAGQQFHIPKSFHNHCASCHAHIAVLSYFLYLHVSDKFWAAFDCVMSLIPQFRSAIACRVTAVWLLQAGIAVNTNPILLSADSAGTRPGLYWRNVQTAAGCKGWRMFMDCCGYRPVCQNVFTFSFVSIRNQFNGTYQEDRWTAI
jgi:hypothetical protein